MESNVHFPTDTSLLYDSVKSSIRTVEKILVEIETEIKGWRKSKYWNNKTKLLSRKLSKIVHGGGKRKHQRVKKATNKYLSATRIISNRIELGLKIAVCTDQHGFILHHSVMERQADAMY